MLLYMEQELAKTPLELLAAAALRPAVAVGTARKLFDCYDRFLAILNDERSRSELESIGNAQMSSSRVWDSIREISNGFQDGLTELFFGKDEQLRMLSTTYGLF